MKKTAAESYQLFEVYGDHASLQDMCEWLIYKKYNLFSNFYVSVQCYLGLLLYIKQLSGKFKKHIMQFK